MIKYVNPEATNYQARMMPIFNVPIRTDEETNEDTQSN